MADPVGQPIVRDESNSVLIKDIILCVAKSDSGPAIYSKFDSREEMANVMVNINLEIGGKIAAHDMKAKQIVKPNAGIIQAARNRLFRR